ncbi:MAG: 23S rRNA (guanosine(2251)-2'-O)-methyltransferase RlmB [Eubacteriales bacterium]|jgi:23S rRNA (guanosine2251-2'-O)-methyltransferase|nr:23S rRNA (guanosine(2251)-2'-O)-methyltransferase RlmB [Eubacteriales bacterium]MDY5718350.1 23S rRNA (guanosine(2251)-2'-O)-methyltransferase RlmB [Eubacteriales bacterium]
MAQYHNSRNYRRDEQRNVNEVVFRDGMPVTYSSRQERGGKRPEGGYNKGGKSFNRGNDRRGAEQKPYYKDGEQKPYYKKRDNAEGRYDRAKKEDNYKAKREETAYKARDKQAENAPQANEEQDELPYLIMGRNAVREAVRSGRSIDKILVTKEIDGSLREIINLARDNNIRVDSVVREKLDELCMPFGHGQKTGNHQGIVAMVPGVEYCEIADILNFAKEKGEKPFIIILDGIEDPHNLGSIIRSAVCAGAHGIIIPRRRAVSVTAAACKASAGAVEYAHIARVANIANAIARLKDEGLWIAGADMSGTAMTSARMEGALALVIGSEGDGIGRLVKEKCDFLVSIPMFGQIDSLNAAVAAAVLMFEKRRQDGIRKN